MLLCSCCFTDREKQHGLLVLSYNRMRINILLQFKKKHRNLKLKNDRTNRLRPGSDWPLVAPGVFPVGRCIMWAIPLRKFK